MPERRGAVRPKTASKLRAEALLGALRHRLAACALSAAALFGFLQPVAAQADPYAQQWNPWVELGGLGADDDDSRALGELWMPLLQGPSALFFFDGKFQFFEEDVREINAALGLRKMTVSGWNLGAWFSGDLRETSNDNSFWQVAGGLEALSVKWDLRVNGYLPVTDPQASPSTAEVVLQRNTIFMIGGQEVALHGFDGEIGYMLFGSPETKPGTRHELRVYGGGFWFDHSDAIDEVAGPSARLEWRIDDLIPDWGGSRLTFDAGWSHDEVRDDIWQVGGRLRIPLGGTKTYALLSPQARRMQERIERDDDIIIVKSGPENVFDTLTGVRFDRVAYVNPSITNVSAEAGDNSLLILNGTVSGPQQLQGNQTLQGGKSTILVTGVKSGVTTSFTAPGAKAHLVDPGNAANLTLLGNNTHVAGLNIIGAGQFSGVGDHGIFGDSDKNNIVIEQTSVSEVNIDGIHFEDNNRNVSIFDTAIARAGNSGIYFNNGNRNVTIADTTITDTESDSISFIDFNRDVTISGVDINDSNFHGIFFNNNNSNVTIADTTVNDARVDGIQFVDFNRNITIARASITNVGNNGITVAIGNSNVRIADTSVVNADADGIFIQDDNRNVTIFGTSVTDVDATGILFGVDNSNVTIANTSIANAGFDGMFFADRNSNVTIAGTSITGAGESGIFFRDDNSNVTIAGAAISGVEDNGIFFSSGNENVTISGTSITDTGASGISFNSSNSNVTISATAITDTGAFGINFNSSNSNVIISATAITDAGDNGIVLNVDNDNVSISGTTIVDPDGSGIVLSIGNDNVSITGTTIADADDFGLRLGLANSVALNDSALVGNFGLNGLQLGAGNTLSGGNNTAEGATFGGVFCNSGAQTGSFAFVDRGVALPTPGTCPP
jgi:hypothetical protein